MEQRTPPPVLGGGVCFADRVRVSRIPSRTGCQGAVSDETTLSGQGKRFGYNSLWSDALGFALEIDDEAMAER